MRGHNSLSKSLLCECTVKYRTCQGVLPYLSITGHGPPVHQFAAGAFQLLGDEFLVGKHSLIFSGKDLVGKIVEGVMDFCRSLFGTQDEPVRKLRAHWSKLGFWPLGNSGIHLLLLAPQNTTNRRTDCLLSHHEQLCLKTPGSRNTISGWKTSKTVPPTMIAAEDARNVGFQFVFGSISLPCYREPHRIKNLGGRLGHTRQEAH